MSKPITTYLLAVAVAGLVISGCTLSSSGSPASTNPQEPAPSAAAFAAAQHKDFSYTGTAKLISFNSDTPDYTTLTLQVTQMNNNPESDSGFELVDSGELIVVQATEDTLVKLIDYTSSDMSSRDASLAELIDTIGALDSNSFILADVTVENGVLLSASQRYLP